MLRSPQVTALREFWDQFDQSLTTHHQQEEGGRSNYGTIGSAPDVHVEGLLMFRRDIEDGGLTLVTRLISLLADDLVSAIEVFMLPCSWSLRCKSNAGAGATSLAGCSRR